MAKNRDSVPRKVEDAVRREFNYRCGVCQADRPQLHHIDGNPGNNDPTNLIPLCPNCHLGGQHDGSNSVPQALLAFFRRHRHKGIMTRQFRPIWNRMAFLRDIPESADAKSLEDRAAELVALASTFEKGRFYGDQLAKLFARPAYGYVWFLGDPVSEARRDAQGEEDDRAFRQQLRESVTEVERLVVELLDFQDWAHVDIQGNPR